MHQLSMSLQQSIWTLVDRGWSNRRIARELGVDRDTVSRWRRRSPSNAAKVTAGSPVPSSAPTEASLPPATAIGSTPCSRSSCTEHTARIQAGIAAGQSAHRIFQDLTADAGTTKIQLKQGTEELDPMAFKGL